MRHVSRFSRWRTRAGTALVTVLVCAGMQAPALARKETRGASSEPPPIVLREGARVTAGSFLDKIIAEVEKRHYPARVIKAEEITVKGRRAYAIRLRDSKSGKVRDIKVDAETGREL